MKIGIVGYGGMGKMVESEAKAKGISIVSIIDPVSGVAMYKELNEQSLEGVDIAIDFTHPDVIMDNIKRYCKLKTNVVIGTTGWYDNLNEIRDMVRNSGIKFLWSSNFSIGVNIYFRMIEVASKLMNYAKDYDVWGYEIHHNNKADSPSGTAKTLSNVILKDIERKKKVVYEMLDRKISPDEFHFASVRGGPVNFEHTIGFDSSADCITIKHAARNRSGYAAGAVHAAIWLHEKSAGYYEQKDFMDELIPMKINFEGGM